MEAVRDEIKTDPEGFKARMEVKRAANNPNINGGQAFSVILLLLMFAGGGAWLYNKVIAAPKAAKLAAARAEEEYKNSPKGKKAAREAQIRQGFGFYGEHTELTRMVKADMDDPESFQLAACNYFDQDDHIVVIEDFRGRNAYGVMQKFSIKAKCGIDGGVIEVMNVKRMR